MARVNVNTATREDLVNVVGLRPDLADDILEFRRLGKITSVEALGEVQASARPRSISCASRSTSGSRAGMATTAARAGMASRTPSTSSRRPPHTTPIRP